MKLSKIIIILTTIATFALIILLYNKVFINRISETSLYKDPSVKEELHFREYVNRDLEIKIFIPITFTIDERITGVILEKNNSKITISNHGTDFGSLDEYWEWKIKPSGNRDGVSDEKKIEIDGHNAISARLYDTKLYLIYIDGQIYGFETDSADLYDDLDNIAQSFEYLPN